VRPLLAVALATAALALAAASARAASIPFAVEYAGTGEGEVWCKVTEPGEEPLPEEFCQGPWPANTRIAFEAPQSEAGSQFKGYEGTGSAAVCAKSCSFKLTEPSAVAARFDLVVRTLRIDRLGDGAGEVEVESECQLFECEIAESPYPGGSELTFAKGAELTLVPEAWPGSEFFAGFLAAKGSAAPCAGHTECAFALEEDSSLSALFELIKLTVQAQGAGQGTVTSEGGAIACGLVCSAPFEEGEEVLLTAAPDPGSRLSGWSGCEGNPAPAECLVTLGPQSAAVTASFDLAAPGAEPEQRPGAEPEAAAQGASAPGPPPPPGKKGTARVAPSAAVRGAVALLRLSCEGGPCRGRLRLEVRVRQARKLRDLPATAPYSLPAGGSGTVAVGLPAPARRLLAAGGALGARVAGTGLAPSTVKLQPPQRKRGPR